MVVIALAGLVDETHSCGAVQKLTGGLILGLRTRHCLSLGCKCPPACYRRVQAHIQTTECEVASAFLLAAQHFSA